MSWDEFHLFSTYFGNKRVKSKLSISRVFLMHVGSVLVTCGDHIITKKKGITQTQGRLGIPCKLSMKFSPEMGS